jgi:iron(III) transport system ATP-binding protein
MTPLLELKALSFQYAAKSPVVQHLDLTVGEGQIACLLGPSGCGKTTVLRLIAGFETPTAGSISIAGRPLSARHIFVPPEQRQIGYVFQDFALFPHLSVAANIGFGLRTLSGTDKQARIEEMLTLVGMQAFAEQFPHELSGGQRQRVALARALAPRPALLLMDEPFSNLDIELRETLAQEVRELLKRLHITALFVTHDQNEAFGVADSVSVMHEGSIEQTDFAYNLYHRPRTRFVADFVGQGVFVSGTATDHATISTELGEMHPTNLDAAEVVAGVTYDVLLRPDDVQHDDASPATARVEHKAFRGADILYTLRLESGTKLLSLVPSHHNHELGQQIGIRLEIDHVVAFARSTTATEPGMTAVNPRQ